MKYDLSNADEAKAALAYLERLITRKNVCEVKKVDPKRSLQQNNYLHLLLGAYGLELGYNIDEAKTVFKRDINPTIFVYEKNGSKFLRSSADLTTAEMTRAIDRFREFADEVNGIYLPPAENVAELRSIENAMERSRNYL